MCNICIFLLFLFSYVLLHKNSIRTSALDRSVLVFLFITATARKAFLVDDRGFSFIAWRIGEFVTVDKGACFFFFFYISGGIICTFAVFPTPSREVIVVGLTTSHCCTQQNFLFYYCDLLFVSLF